MPRKHDDDTGKDFQLSSQDLQDIRGPDDLCRMAEMMGYGDRWGQLQCNNGAFVSSFLNFLTDNPGAVSAIVEWVEQNYDNQIGAVDAAIEEQEEEDDDSQEE